MASSSVTNSMVSTIARSNVSGMKPAPIPWMLCNCGRTGCRLRICVITGLAAGSTPTETIFLSCTCLIYRDTPVIVPPVPMPATKTSIAPPLSAEHYHRERNHQGKGNVLLFPAAEQRAGCHDGKVRCKERLGGLLKTTTGRPHDF